MSTPLNTGNFTRGRNSVSETGHAKNVANFQELIAYVTGYQAAYNPNKDALKLPQLIALKAEADAKLASVIFENNTFNNTVNERQIIFSGLKPLATRLINALQATDASPEIIKDAKTFNRKLQGKRASKAVEPNDPDAPAPNTISASQQSFTQQIQHFAGLVILLESESSYKPNEAELKVDTLLDLQTRLTDKNNQVATAHANVSNARISRNTTLYGVEGSIFDVAAEVKKYIKSLFGATSPQYDQVKALQFRKVGVKM